MALWFLDELLKILSMRVAIYGKKVTKQTIPVFTEVFSFIEQLGWSIVLEKELKDTLLAKTDINKNYDTFLRIKTFIQVLIWRLVLVEMEHLLRL